MKFLPGEPKLRWFKIASDTLVPEWIRLFLRNQLFGVTPNVPTTLLDLASDSQPIRALKLGFILGLFFCLGGTVVSTGVSGTLYGSDPNQLYFYRDWSNITNYAIICPAYIGITSAFTTLVLQSWTRLRRESLIRLEPVQAPRLPFSILVFLLVVVSAIITTRYISECLDPMIYQRNSWYVVLDSNGNRFLNLAGIFYTILNFTLLLISLIAVASLSLFAYIASVVGRSLRTLKPSHELQFEQLQTTLKEFTWAYAMAKLLTAAFILNSYTWKWEKPQGSFNLILMISVLAVFGIIIVSLPRYYIELEWFHFKVRKAEALSEPIPRDSDDIRDNWIRDIACVVDVFFGVGWIISFLV